MINTFVARLYYQARHAFGLTITFHQTFFVPIIILKPQLAFKPKYQLCHQDIPILVEVFGIQSLVSPDCDRNVLGFWCCCSVALSSTPFYTCNFLLYYLVFKPYCQANWYKYLGPPSYGLPPVRINDYVKPSFVPKSTDLRIRHHIFWSVTNPDRVIRHCTRLTSSQETFHFRLISIFPYLSNHGVRICVGLQNKKIRCWKS